MKRAREKKIEWEKEREREWKKNWPNFRCSKEEKKIPVNKYFLLLWLFCNEKKKSLCTSDERIFRWPMKSTKRSEAKLMLFFRLNTQTLDAVACDPANNSYLSLETIKRYANPFLQQQKIRNKFIWESPLEHSVQIVRAVFASSDCDRAQCTASLKWTKSIKWQTRAYPCNTLNRWHSLCYFCATCIKNRYSAAQPNCIVDLWPKKKNNTD